MVSCYLSCPVYPPSYSFFVCRVFFVSGSFVTGNSKHVVVSCLSSAVSSSFVCRIFSVNSLLVTRNSILVVVFVCRRQAIHVCALCTSVVVLFCRTCTFTCSCRTRPRYLSPQAESMNAHRFFSCMYFCVFVRLACPVRFFVVSFL